MTKTFLIPLALLCTILSYCKKGDNNPDPVNCIGLITDTLPTGNTGRIFMPNAITPNGDGLNDGVAPYMQNIKSFVLTIYNQKNEIVFSTTKPGERWTVNGLTANLTLYYYKIQATTNDNYQIGVCGDLFVLTCIPSHISMFRFPDQLTPWGFIAITSEAMGSCR